MSIGKIISIICLTYIIISIIAGIAPSITKKNNDNCGEALLNRIIKTIWRINDNFSKLSRYAESCDCNAESVPNA